ncbi:hypothetical protein HPB47_027225 [Ixodes persulcatus]|uniref:Uncharacterized protein n=1 Tax=Ixodes persulcatus TaxID=34615 RepID=A0AC60PWD4_IXOPE|nr:hypothetical protein HPB47_027225 [Ixodes persulcatus]
MGTRVVLKLLEPLLGKGYCVTIDSFYTLPELVDALIKDCTDVYGTVRANRKEMPPEFRAPKLKKGDTHAYQRVGGRHHLEQRPEVVHHLRPAGGADVEKRRSRHARQAPLLECLEQEAQHQSQENVSTGNVLTRFYCILTSFHRIIM